jgi:ABC-2 type transport system permease protein
VSGVAKNDAAIAPFTNLITLPQFLLAGTFFPIDNFPKWLQPVSKVLPLTHLNQAMRDVAFEGAHISDCVGPLTILLLWGAAAYTVAVMVFKWE